MSSLRRVWNGPLLVKDIAKVEDVESCAAGIFSSSHSSHSSRWLARRVPSSASVLPGIVNAGGDRLGGIMAGGIRYGGDVVKAWRSGATATAVGRI